MLSIIKSTKIIQYQINRYPPSQDRSLRAWSAADELMINHAQALDINLNQLTIINDSFGFLACALHTYNPKIIVERYSQRKAILKNLENNYLELDNKCLIPVLNDFDLKTHLALIKMPKSNALFELYLNYLLRNASTDIQIIIGFMTRHFTAEWLNIASKYFESIEQSRAVKKARVLKLSIPKKIETSYKLFNLQYQLRGNQIWSLSQYPGVFSQSHIDYGTQFLMENIELDQNIKTALDLCSGNGIIAKFIHQKIPHVEVHLIDDSYLAIQSSRKNVSKDTSYFHWNNTLENIPNKSLDLILCNPPFHSEYTNTLDIAMALFKEALFKLKPDGQFYIVVNKHLNYDRLLSQIFSKVGIVNQNDKYKVYIVSS